MLGFVISKICIVSKHILHIAKLGFYHKIFDNAKWALHLPTININQLQTFVM